MEPANNYGTTDNGKTAGIISYFTIIGWLIAYLAFHQNNRTSLGSFQLRQTLLFHIISMILSYGLGIAFGAIWLTTGLLSLATVISALRFVLFVIWIIGIIGAIQGEKKAMPLIGDWAQTMFPGI